MGHAHNSHGGLAPGPPGISSGDGAFKSTLSGSTPNPNKHDKSGNHPPIQGEQSYDRMNQTNPMESIQTQDATSEADGEKNGQQSHGLTGEPSDSWGMSSVVIDNAQETTRHVQGWPLFFLLLGICFAVFIISIDRTVITTVSYRVLLIFTHKLTNTRLSRLSLESSVQQATLGGTAHRTSSLPAYFSPFTVAYTLCSQRNGRTSYPSLSSK